MFTLQMSCLCATWLLFTFSSACGGDREPDQARFTVTDLGTFGDGDSFATAINNVGQVLGRVSNPEKDDGLLNQQVFLWERGKITPLGTDFAAVGMNDKGEVVGMSIPPDYNPFNRSEALQHPVLVTGQHASRFLGQSQIGYARAINNSAQVVGILLHTPMTQTGQGVPVQAYLWGAGHLRLLPVPSPYTQGMPVAINDHSDVVGYLQTKPPPDVLLPPKTAVLWKQDEAIVLGTLPSADQSEAIGINNQGEILCKAFWVAQPPSSSLPGEQTAQRKYSQRGFLWRGGHRQDLAPRSQSPSWGIDVASGNIPSAFNDNRQVVGRATDLEGKDAAFVWENNVMKNLNHFIPSNSGWELLEATGINDKGKIVGYGEHNGLTRAFLLTPAQGPHSAASALQAELFHPILVRLVHSMSQAHHPFRGGEAEARRGGGGTLPRTKRGDGGNCMV